MLTLADIGFDAPPRLLAGYGLRAARASPTATPIPGSYWGEREAGLIGTDRAMRAPTRRCIRCCTRPAT